MAASDGKITPTAKMVLVVIGIVAIVIPVLLTYILITPPSTGQASTSSTNTITIPAGIGSNLNLNFEPASITVASGTTVTWINDDTSTHNIYFTSMPPGATVSPNPSPDTTSWGANMYSVTLTTPGTYNYECQYHSGWMHGTITVTG